MLRAAEICGGTSTLTSLSPSLDSQSVHTLLTHTRARTTHAPSQPRLALPRAAMAKEDAGSASLARLADTGEERAVKMNLGAAKDISHVVAAFNAREDEVAAAAAAT